MQAARYSRRRRPLLLAIIAGCWCIATSGWAQAPTDAETLFQAARRHYHLGEYGEAATKFTTAARLDPALAGAYRWLGLTYRALGECDRAIAYFEKYLQLRPSGKYTARVRSELAHCAVALGIDLSARAQGGEAQIVLRVSVASAMIIVDGVRRGTAPLGPVPVRRGAHTVEVLRSGYLPWKRAVQLGDGEVLVLDAKLAKAAAHAARTPRAATASGQLRLVGLVPRAELRINGAGVQLSTRGQVRLPAGTYRLDVDGPGLTSWSGKATVMAGKTAVVHVALQLSPGNRRLRRWGWVAIGAAAVMGLAGAVVGLIENAEYEEVRRYDRRTGTRAELVALDDARRAQAVAAAVLYGAATAALAAGVTLLAVTPEISAERGGGARLMLSGRLVFW